MNNINGFTVHKAKKSHLMVLLCCLIFLFISCNKLVEVDGPKTSVSSQNIYQNNATAIGALTNLYANIGNSELYDLSSVAGLSADELTVFVGNTDANRAAIYQNSLTSSLNLNFWQNNYKGIFVTNAALEGITASTGLSPLVKQQLLGEAHFMRAYYYFYLVNLYGNVPLVLGTDYKTNALLARSPKEQVYERIIEDLKEAKDLLSPFYLAGDLAAYPGGSEERVRPTKWAATALLARAYLYTSDWINAEIQSSEVLNNTSQYMIEQADQVFIKNNREAIWQVQTILDGGKVPDASNFILPETGPAFNMPYYLSAYLMDSFEAGDERKNNWINYVTVDGTTFYYPYKYKNKEPLAPVTEYCAVLRLSEQYLIRAEARAQQGDLHGSIEDVDIIRDRAGLTLLENTNPDISKDDLLTHILQQKRLEFFAECGHRWLDLKRTGKVDQVMSVITPEKSNGKPWNSFQQWYPIFYYELQLGLNLIQTPGYN